MVETISASISETGPHRDHNEDSLAACIPEDPHVLARKGLLYLLADGVGGQLAGEVASSTGVETTRQEYYSPSSPSRIEQALRHAVQSANLRVYDLAQKHVEYRQMQTTLSVLSLAGAGAYIAHVGDSRIYHYRDGQLRQLTSDHSEAAELVRMRVVPKDKLREHPRRNILTRTLGNQLMMRPDFLRQDVLPGDQFLQCTDGLWSELADEEIEEALRKYDPSEACRRLVDTVIERDGSDNISLQIVRVIDVSADADPGSGRSGWLSGILQRVSRG